MTKMVLDAFLPPADEEACWETYHENSKTEAHDRPPPQDYIRRRMAEMVPSLQYEGYPTIVLPAPMALDVPLGAVMRRRITGRAMRSDMLSLEQVATTLFYAYGETRDNADTPFPRPFRTVPSGGALYPLDLFIHTARVEGLPAGFHYYDPVKHALRLVRRGDHTHKLQPCFVQRELPLQSSVQLFITCLFQRTMFKYRDRGYRFALLEAGHVAQNFNLAATALDLAVTCVGGYFDREIDALLELDGLTRSTIYTQVLGVPGDDPDTAHW